MSIQVGEKDLAIMLKLGGGFKYFLFSPLLGEGFPFWLIFFKRVETTNGKIMHDFWEDLLKPMKLLKKLPSNLCSVRNKNRTHWSLLVRLNRSGWRWTQFGHDFKRFHWSCTWENMGKCFGGGDRCQVKILEFTDSKGDYFEICPASSPKAFWAQTTNVPSEAIQVDSRNLKSIDIQNH